MWLIIIVCEIDLLFLIIYIYVDFFKKKNLYKNYKFLDISFRLPIQSSLGCFTNQDKCFQVPLA